MRTWMVLVLLFGTVSCSNDKLCKTVEEVGGCSDQGCGVKFTDGSYGTAYYPVKGRYVCKDKTNYFPAEGSE